MYLNPQQVCILINIIGGIAVIGSYVIGFSTHPGSINSFWGNASKNVQKLYAISMIFSALSYFAFSYLILFKISSDTVNIFNIFNFNTFSIVYAVMLLASTLWMPLTFSWLNSQSNISWIYVRIVLALVGLSSLFLTILIFGLPHNLGVIYWLAVAGSMYFCFHTLVLDAIIWPTFFR
jgi:hypothetical protein